MPTSTCSSHAAAGLADLTAGLVTIESLLVSIAAPGLRDVGLAVGQPIPDAELQLYALLSARDGLAALGRYNALLRRVSAAPVAWPPDTGGLVLLAPRGGRG